MTIIQHPTSARPIEGKILAPGRMFGERDYYADEDGTWKQCPIPGTLLAPDDERFWVRIPDLMTPEEALGKVRPPMYRDDTGFEFG